MIHIPVTLVEAESARRVELSLPRVPAVGEFIVIGEAVREVERVTYVCGDDTKFVFAWVHASKVPPEIDDVLEEP